MAAEGEQVVASPAAGSPSTEQPGQQPQQPQQGANGQQQPAQAASQPGAQPGNQPGNDDVRYRGAVADLQKERRARQEAAANLARMQGELEAANKRIQALAGVTVPSKDEQSAEQVRQQFLELFPKFKWLTELTDEQVAAMMKMPSVVGKADQLEQREWNQRGRTYQGKVATRIAEALGVEKLSDKQSNTLRDAFAGWFRDTVQAELEASGGESSATLDRYESDDEGLVDDFAKLYTENWITPARRNAIAHSVNRASQRVPDSSGRGAISTVPKPEFKGEDLDARLKFATDILKERGVQFGR